MSRVLFVLKKRSFGYSSSMSSGLHNSAKYVQEMLEGEGIPSRLVHVIDNNGIDRVVSLFRPTHVFIEAYWVVPEKFKVLRKLHPRVKWIVRNHSELPFLALEGMTMDWTMRYVDQDNVMVSSNSPDVTDSFRVLIRSAYPEMPRKAKTPLLTNVYPPFQILNKTVASKWLNVGCFGAIRPLKNQLIQAVAAVRYAESIGKKLRFHINASRVEGKAEPILNNLRELFDHLPGHQLVEHGWLDLEDYFQIVSQMHVITQVSFSETFNFVAADAIAYGTPIVVSAEVPWAVDGIADANSDVDIAGKIGEAIDSRMRNVKRNGRALALYTKESKSLWLDFLK